MKILLPLLLSILSTCALAQAPIARGPGTTNTPAAWTNIVLLTVAPETNKLGVDLRAALHQTNSSVASVTNAGSAAYSNASAFDASGAASGATNGLTLAQLQTLGVNYASNIVSGGTIPTAALSTNVAMLVNGVLSVTTVNATNLQTFLTNKVLVTDANGFVVAASGAGAIADALLSSNVPLKNSNNAFTAENYYTGSAGTLTVNTNVLGSGAVAFYTGGVVTNDFRFSVQFTTTTMTGSSPGNNAIFTNVFNHTFSRAPAICVSINQTGTHSFRLPYYGNVPFASASTTTAVFYIANNTSPMNSGTYVVDVIVVP